MMRIPWRLAAAPIAGLAAHPRFRWYFYPLVFLLVSLSVGIGDAQRGAVRGDLTRFSLAASRVMAKGGDPYAKAEVGKNYKYTPLNATLLLPLAPLPNHAAQGIFVGLGFTLLLACADVHHRLAGGGVPWWVHAATLAVTGRYFVHNLNLGQWNLYVYTLAFLGVVLAWKHPRWGGLLAGLAAALKFMPATFVLFFLAVRRGLAAAWLAAATLLWLVAVPLLVHGPTRSAELWDRFAIRSQRTAGYIMDESSVVGVSAKNFLYSLLTPTVRRDLEESEPINLLSLQPATARAISGGAMVLLVVATFGVIAWRGHQRVEPTGTERLLAIGLVFALWILVSPNVRKANLLVLATPVFALGAAVAQGMLGPWLRGIALTAIAGSAVLTALLSSSVGGRIGIDTPMDILGAHTLQILLVWTASMMVLGHRIVVHRERKALPAMEPAPATATPLPQGHAYPG